jgi:hypothetical protein
MSSTMMVRRGCPQGGVLSPLLWNMVIKSLLRSLNNESLWAQGFADDIAIVINGNADMLKHRWFFFTNNRKLVGFKKPILFGTELQLKNQVKYLGIILDKNLNRNSHIDHRMQKATITFWQCRRAIGKTWGLKPKIVYSDETLRW